MELKELKLKLEEGTFSSCNVYFIFKNLDKNRFLPMQYIHKIADIKNVDIEFIDDISGRMKQNMFYVPGKNIQVYFTEELTTEPIIKDNLIIVTKKISNKIEDVIEFPKLEHWQIKDYAYSVGKGIDPKDLDYMLDAVDYDITWLNTELSKIIIFNEQERKYLVKELAQDKQLERNNTETIFNFTDALLNKNLDALINIYENILCLDIEPLGVVTIMYKNLKNMLLTMQPNPTEQNTGLPSKQIWGIKKSMENKSHSNIFKMYNVVSEIDYLLKNGDLPANMILDYTVLKCLAC